MCFLIRKDQFCIQNVDLMCVLYKVRECKLFVKVIHWQYTHSDWHLSIIYVTFFSAIQAGLFVTCYFLCTVLDTRVMK